jgi:hypothetical protein
LEDSFWLGEDEYRKEKVPLLPKRAKTNQDNTFVSLGLMNAISHIKIVDS